MLGAFHFMTPNTILNFISFYRIFFVIIFFAFFACSSFVGIFILIPLTVLNKLVFFLLYFVREADIA